jgi:hypothetical protein
MPENPDHKVPGILKFAHDSGGRLTLIGGLRTPEDLAVPEATPGGGSQLRITDDLIQAAGTYGRLHGECDGRALTLEKCFQLRSRGSFFSRPYEEVIYVNHVYDGAWFTDDEAVAGDKLTFALDGLTEWVGLSGIGMTVFDKPDPGTPWVQLDGSSLAREEVSLDDGGRATLVHRLSTSQPGTSVSLKEGFVLSFEYEDKVAVEVLLDSASDVQDVVSIATDRSAQYQEIEVYHPDLVDDRERRHSFKVWSAWTALRQEGAKPLSRHDLFFTLQDLGGMKGLSEWMRVASKYRSPLGRAMATKYSERMYVSDRFLNCAAALEGFDRIDTGVAQGRIFADRIRRCVDIAGPQFGVVIHDADRWVEELKHNRNEIAHHYGRRMRQATEEQVDISGAAAWLLIFCLLREASAPEALFDKIIKHRKLQYLAGRHRTMFA